MIDWTVRQDHTGRDKDTDNNRQDKRKVQEVITWTLNLFVQQDILEKFTAPFYIYVKAVVKTLINIS